jgi:hypothetical protein
MNNRSRYGKGWEKRARRCRELANWQCERCQVKHGTMRISKWTLRLWPVYLVAAHVNHDPENPDAELVAVCPSCHWKHYKRPGQIAPWQIEKIKHRLLIKQAYLA